MCLWVNLESTVCFIVYFINVKNSDILIFTFLFYLFSTTSEMNLNEKREEDVHTHTETSPEFSCVSIKSHQSMPIPLQFSGGAETLDSK